MEKEYTVIATAREHLSDLEVEITASSGAGPIPNRAVDIANARPGSKIQTHFMLTDEEAEALRNDPRVRAVEIPPDQRDDIKIGLNAEQSEGVVFRRGEDGSSVNVNWGLRRCIEETNIYGSSELAPGGYLYALDGTGVDVVIQDSGVDQDHPEWEDAEGTTRFQAIDWYLESGISGTQDAFFYNDYDGHGTHCAGIAAGKTYGWAKGARIYAQKLGGLEGTADPGNGISISDSFDAIRLWHNAKTDNRPTIVNMSWGYSAVYTQDPDSGTYQGTPWTFAAQTETELWDDYGIVSKFSGGDDPDFRRIPSQVAFVDAEVEDMIADGIHICIAAGNDYYKADIPSGTDYDNAVVFGGITRYYHRPSSPYSSNAFIVGNIDSTTTTVTDRTAGSSKKGPAVNMWAPGTNIMSTCSLNYNTNSYTPLDYPSNTDYKIMSIGGTSMASPQVAGVAALYLQSRPYLTPAQLKDIMNTDSKSVINQTANNDSDYRSFTLSIMGSPNRHLYSKYGVLNPFTITTESVAPVVTTYNISVTNSGSTSYVLSGSDRNGAVSGNDPTIEFLVGDVIEFNLSVSGHPFWIKTAAVTGTGSTVSTGVTNNGQQSVTCTWNTTGVTPGTYYYICQFHGSMVGQIIIGTEE
jgi:subtilisin family serine protease